MKENLKEGLKRNIYHELATHDVIKKEEKDRLEKEERVKKEIKMSIMFQVINLIYFSNFLLSA